MAQRAGQPIIQAVSQARNLTQPAKAGMALRRSTVKILTIKTNQREQMLRITPELARLVSENGWQEGALLVYCPHTTASLTINESADPDVFEDMTRFMGKLVPQDPSFRHDEGNSDAHIKSSLFGPHCMLIVEGGQIRKGTWQGVYFCEWDGPRTREVWVRFLRA